MIGGFFNINILLHVGAVCEQNSHGDRERVEHLFHRGDHGHPGEVREIRDKDVFYPCHGAGAGHGVDRDDQRQHHEDWHHNLGSPFNAALHSHDDEKGGHARKEQETHLAAGGTGDEI